VSTRVSPTEQLRAEIDDVFGQSEENRQLGDTLEEVARLGARLLLQSALEAEVTEFLCRNRYERRKLASDARNGSRNGYSDLTVKTTAGAVTLKRPKLRGTTEQFASRLLGKGVTRTNALESLVIAGIIRGLSVRDVEAALAEASDLRPLCPSPRCRGCARRSKASSTLSAAAAWPTSSSSTCSSTAATSSTTPAPRPNRCSSPGGSPRTGKPVLLHLARAHLSPPMPGQPSSMTWPPGGCARRCSWSLIGRRGSWPQWR